MEGFKENIQKLSSQISERQVHITNEEMAKQALIIPFLQALGYDVFSPLEVKPEFDADFAKKKGEKVDYAVFKDGTPIIFIEAKAPNQKLAAHDAQLARYYNAVPDVKFAIITNGIEYKFFTDLDNNNIMDDEPFYTLDMLNIIDTDIDVLVRLRKENFASASLVEFAEELTYMSNLNLKLGEIFKNPPDEFIRYVIKDFSDTRVTQNVIERFRPIVKRAISQALIDIVSQGINLSSAEAASTLVKTVDVGNVKSPITTADELKGFEIIKEILIESGSDVSELDYKDTINYFGIHNRNTWSWFVRLALDTSKKNIIVRLPIAQIAANGFQSCEYTGADNSTKIYIDSIEDLYQLKPVIIESFKGILK